MTVGETIQGFRGWLDNSGHTSNESNWSPELIYQHMLKYRAAFIHAKLYQGREVGYENYKIIPCINLVKVDRNECPCAPRSGCSFRKTEIPIIRNIFITSVSSLLGEIKYEYVQWDRFEDKLNHRLKSLASEPYYTYKTIGDSTYHYLYNDNHKKHLTYTMIPYDPIEYAMMRDCEGNSNQCVDAYDVRFPMDADMEAQLFMETYNSLVVPRPQEADVFNNGMKDQGLPLK